MGTCLHWIAKHNIFYEDLQFRDAFVKISEMHDVEWKRSGAQHHGALEIRGRHHEPIKRLL